MRHRSVYLYGFDYLHNLVDVKFLMDDAIGVGGIKEKYRWMLVNNPSIVDIYAIDNSWDLKSAYREVCRAKDFASRIEFWDYVANEGITIYKRT